MNKEIEELVEDRVFYYFDQISNIPRESGNEKAISCYLLEFAKEHNLEVIQDESLNIIIKKKASKGYENAPTVILQGHMDMVCVKDKNIEHDFEKDGIKLKIDGDFLKASGTTLGADNGIAMAYCLAILENDEFSHPPLEVVFTIEEETGMRGASSLKKENLSGKILINMDSEEEGELLCSCAGGVRNKVSLNIETNKLKDNFVSYNLKVSGLKGGHSGAEINKQRGNANKIIGRILNDINSSLELYLVSINGGDKMNAIPREAEAIVSVKKEDELNISNIILKWDDILKNEFRNSDKEVKIELEKSNDIVKNTFNKTVTDKAIQLLMLIPNGVQSMSMDIEGLVQSSNNLGVVTTSEDEITFESAIRSSVRSLKYEIVNRIQTICDIVGVDMSLQSDYPEWEFREDSKIRDILVDTYNKMYGEKPKVNAIHAGLECGILGNILGDMDMISFGPNMYDVHTAQEALSISSAKRVFKYLVNVLENIK